MVRVFLLTVSISFYINFSPDFSGLLLLIKKIKDIVN